MIHKAFLPSAQIGLSAPELTINTDREDETRMRTLSAIEEFNGDGTNPGLDELLEHLSIVKPQLELTISELSDKECIETVITSWRDMYSKVGYKITEKGKNALELHLNDVKFFISMMMKAYHGGESSGLYNLVWENKDLLRYGYLKGLITKSEIENIAKKLDLNVGKMWWDFNFEYSGIGGI